MAASGVRREWFRAQRSLGAWCLSLVLAGVTLGVSVGASPAHAEVLGELPTQVKLNKIKPTPFRSKILVSGYAYMTPLFVQKKTGLTPGKGKVQIFRALRGQDTYRLVAKASVGNQGYFQARVKAKRNAYFFARYPGATDEWVTYLPSQSKKPTYSPVTHRMRFSPASVASTRGNYWDAYSRPQRAKVRVDPNYRERRVDIYRQKQCRGKFRFVGSVKTDSGGRAKLALRRGALYSCFRFWTKSGKNYAGARYTKRLGAKGWGRF